MGGKRASNRSTKKRRRTTRADRPAEARARARGRAEGRRGSARRLSEYQLRLRALASELSIAEERERRRIAADIHDHISQNLAIAKIKLSALRAAFSQQSDNGRDAQFSEVLDLLSQTLEDTRTMSFELSPPVLYELGLSSALQWLGEQFAREYHLRIHVDGGECTSEASDDVRGLLFRAARELLINVVKHADATAARVSLHQAKNWIRLTVSDDGKGADARRLRCHSGRPGGFGLFSIRTRIEEIGGKMDISSVPGGGSHVTLIAPLSISAGAKT